MEKEADLFEDAASVSSVNSQSAWNKGKTYISLSRCTVYHSAQDLQAQQSDEEESQVMAAVHEPVQSNSDSHESKVSTVFSESVLLPYQLYTHISMHTRACVCTYTRTHTYVRAC
jgi:hypothetical protein